MKKILALLLAALICVGLFAGCAGGDSKTSNSPSGGGDAANSPSGGDAANSPSGGGDAKPKGGTINVYAFTNEIPNAIKRYKELHPEFPYDFNITEKATDDGAYQAALDQALANGEVDLFAAESAFVLKYTTGDFAQFALPYKDLGIDIDAKISAANIATYAYEIGTRESDNAIVGLPFQNTGGCAIYRRSIAKDVWGTDDPATIAGKIGPGWEQFLRAAAELKAKGYCIASGEGDIWQVVRNVADTPYVVDGKLFLDPKREAFIDIAKALYDGEYTNRVSAWNDGWYADMGGTGPSPVFCFLGPAWLINYVMINNVGDTFGDWAVTNAPVGFSWGGTWLVPTSNGNADIRDGVKEILEWVTLDTSNTGFQYYFANGNLFEGSTLFPDKAQEFAEGKFTKDAVGSGVVMDKADGTLDILGGQNMFEYFIPAGKNARGDFFSQYDESISALFMDQVSLYTDGTKTREEAIRDFKQNASDRFDMEFGN